MKKKVFIDTGFWIALIDKRDSNHQLVEKNLKHLIQSCILCTSEFIVYETITYLNCSIKNHSLAVRFLEKMEKEEGITVLDVDVDIKIEALKIFKKYSDKHLSFVDCTSFALMRKAQIDSYTGFDSHFFQMGFSPIFT